MKLRQNDSYLDETLSYMERLLKALVNDGLQVEEGPPPPPETQKWLAMLRHGTEYQIEVERSLRDLWSFLENQQHRFEETRARVMMAGPFGFYRNYQLIDLQGQGEELFNIDAGRTEQYSQNYQIRLTASLLLPLAGVSPKITIKQNLTMKLIEN